MEIAIFNEVATGECIEALKAEGTKYAGLYVDMNDPKQRKYVKDNASHIKELKKKVDRKRIDAVKEFKIQVEKQAASIIEDLNIANLPFESLIDEYAAERKIILDAEKADKESRERAAQLEIDHEFGLLMNDKFDSDKIGQEQARIAHEEKIRADAVAEAKQDLINAENQAKEDKARAVEQAEQAEVKRLADVEQARVDADARLKQGIIESLQREKDAERGRLSNVEHVRGINRMIYGAFRDSGLERGAAILATQALIDNKIPHTQLNY